MQFEVKAYRPGGTVEALLLEAESEAIASRMVQTDGYSVLSVKAMGLSRLGAFARHRKFPLALFSQELIALLDAGIPLPEALETLSRKERSAVHRGVLDTLVASLKSGESFSRALERQPHAFPPLYVAVARSSERSGNLVDALSRFVGYERQVDVLRAKILNASIYPLVLMVVGGLVTMFLLFYVMPKFSHVYDERAMRVGGAAELLLALGGALEGRLPIALAAFAIMAAGLVYAVRSPQWRARGLARLASVALIGERLRTFQLARFYRTAGMLLRGGFPVTGAFSLAAELLDPALRVRLENAKRMIAEGLPISRAMETQGLSSPIAARLLAVGEQGGNMGEMMQRIADFHDEETARWVDWTARLFEPLLMIAIGLVIGAVVLLMYMPIFDLAGNLR